MLNRLAAINCTALWQHTIINSSTRRSAANRSDVSRPLRFLVSVWSVANNPS